MRPSTSTGVAVDEIEALRLDGSRRNEDVMWRMADMFGASHVHVLGPYAGDMSAAADELGRICDEAASHGLRVAIEFFPPTNVPDVRTAMEIVRACGPRRGVVRRLVAPLPWHMRLGGAGSDRPRSSRLDPAQRRPGAADASTTTSKTRWRTASCRVTVTSTSSGSCGRSTRWEWSRRIPSRSSPACPRSPTRPPSRCDSQTPRRRLLAEARNPVPG